MNAPWPTSPTRSYTHETIDQQLHHHRCATRGGLEAAPRPDAFASWWHGVEDTEEDERGRVLFHRDDGAVMPSLVTTGRSRVVVSCLELHIRYEWTLDALDGGGTRVTARCTLPEPEAARQQTYRAAVALSLRRLVELAEAATGAPRARG